MTNIHVSDYNMPTRDAIPEPSPVLPPTIRNQLLRETITTICGDRDKTYGPPLESYENIAKFWNIFLADKIKRSHSPWELLTPADVAKMMILFKVSRSLNSAHRDNWLDIAGYAACGCEVETELINQTMATEIGG